MNPPITITTQIIGTEETNAVNAREVHKALEIKKDFSSWIKGQIESLGLEENVDYMVFTQKGENLSGGRPGTEYILSIDAAKHIAMASRSAKGKAVRAYFIEVEKEYRHQAMAPAALLPVLTQMSRSIESILAAQLRLFERIEALEDERTTKERFLCEETKEESYTKEEEHLIMHLKSQGKTNDYIAKKLGRTNAAIRAKCTRLRAAVAAKLLENDL